LSGSQTGNTVQVWRNAHMQVLYALNAAHSVMTQFKNFQAPRPGTLFKCGGTLIGKRFTMCHRCTLRHYTV
jgi:hypothetical protein